MTLEMAPLVHPCRSLFLSFPLKSFISWISWRNTCSVHMLERLPVSFSSIKEMDNTSKESLVTTLSPPMTACQSLNWNTKERKFRGWILTKPLWPRAALWGKIQVWLRSEAHGIHLLIILHVLEILLLPKNISILPVLNLSSHWLQDQLHSPRTFPGTGKSSQLVACLTMGTISLRSSGENLHISILL